LLIDNGDTKSQAKLSDGKIVLSGIRAELPAGLKVRGVGSADHSKCKIRAISPFKVIQGHRYWYQSKAHIRLLIKTIARQVLRIKS